MRAEGRQRMLTTNDDLCPRYRRIRDCIRLGTLMTVMLLLLAGHAIGAEADDGSDASATCKRTGEVAGSAWSEVEHWLWLRVCTGKSSDLRQAPGGDTTIRPDVLREIVTSDAATDHIVQRRIGILGMHVPGRLDLSDADIDRALIIAESTIEGGLLLDRVRTRSILSFGGSSITGAVQAHGAELGGSLILRKARFEAIKINGSQIHGALDLAGAQVRDDVEIDGSAIGGSIKMNDNGRYGAVRIRSTSVGGQISLNDAEVEGQLDLQEVRTPESVLLGGLPIGEIRIVGSNIGGTLALDGSTVSGYALIGSNSIGRTLFARHATFKSALDITLNRIKGNIDLRGSKLTELDLSETQADKALQLASEGHNVEWTTEATPRINLHQLQVGSSRMPALSGLSGWNANWTDLRTSGSGACKAKPASPVTIARRNG